MPEKSQEHNTMTLATFKTRTPWWRVRHSTIAKLWFSLWMRCKSSACDQIIPQSQTTDQYTESQREDTEQRNTNDNKNTIKVKQQAHPSSS